MQWRVDVKCIGGESLFFESITFNIKFVALVMKISEWAHSSSQNQVFLTYDPWREGGFRFFGGGSYRENMGQSYKFSPEKSIPSWKNG